MTPNGAIVLQNTQNAYAVRRLLQPLLGLPLNKIRVQYWEGSSTYGNSVARYDSGLAAAVASQLAGAPVRLQFMRWDDHGWDNFGQAQLMDIRGGVDAKGAIVATASPVTSDSSSNRAARLRDSGGTAMGSIQADGPRRARLRPP